MRNVLVLAATIVILGGCAYGYEAPEDEYGNPKKIPETQGKTIFELGKKTESADTTQPGGETQYETTPTVNDPEYQEYLEWKQWQEFKEYQEWKRQQEEQSAS